MGFFDQKWDFLTGNGIFSLEIGFFVKKRHLPPEMRFFDRKWHLPGD